MQIVDGVLNIDAKIDNEQITLLSKMILQQIEQVKEICVDASNGVASSALFSLLASVKKTAPHIHIALLEGDVAQIEGIGKMSIDIRG